MMFVEAVGVILSGCLVFGVLIFFLGEPFYSIGRCVIVCLLKIIFVDVGCTLRVVLICVE